MEEPVGYSPWGHRELDTTEQLSTAHAGKYKSTTLTDTTSDKSFHINNIRHYKTFQYSIPL